jgi:NAD(P)-dependent dehydrogenase (short-subunit alcohol dehydrogenase family)
MRIAITGHSRGIGKALAKQYAELGHEIVGISRSNGFNIADTNSILDAIKPCDMFINNANSGFAQIDLLFAVHNMWRAIPNKTIIIISSMVTTMPITNKSDTSAIIYRTQKIALEDAYRQLFFSLDWPKMCLVKPGAVATQPGQELEAPHRYADVTNWARTLVRLLESVGPDLEINEIALGVSYK